MKNLDVVVVGELNADLILSDLQSFPELGKEKISQGMVLTMGSASAILASNISRLGMRVGFSGLLGMDSFGDLVISTLAERGVDVSGIRRIEDTKTGLTVTMSFPNDYAMVTYMGSMAEFSLKDVDMDLVSSAKHLHFSSYYLQPAIRKDCVELFKKAKSMGLTTSLDPGWDPEENWEEDILDVLPFVDVMLPNKNEALLISGKESVEDAIRFLGEMSENVVVKNGSEGAQFYSSGKTIRTGVFNVDPVDTTGAGDSFNSGYLFGWLRGEDPEKCMLYGSACGAIATTKIGGSTASPDLATMEQFIIDNPTQLIKD